MEMVGTRISNYNNPFVILVKSNLMRGIIVGVSALGIILLLFPHLRSTLTIVLIIIRNVCGCQVRVLAEEARAVPVMVSDIPDWDVDGRMRGQGGG